MFTNQSIKQKYWGQIILSILLLVGLFIPTITNAQTCPPAQVMTGTATSSISGVCLFCSVSNTSAAADASLSTGASFNLTAGVGVTGKIQVTSSPRVQYPAGSAVTAVIDNGGGTASASVTGIPAACAANAGTLN